MSLLARWQVTGNPCLEQVNQRRFHEVEVVGYVEADDPAVLELGLEHGRQPGPMAALHDEDQVRPKHDVGLT